MRVVVAYFKLQSQHSPGLNAGNHKKHGDFKFAVFYDVTPCGLVGVYCSFGGTSVFTRIHGVISQKTVRYLRINGWPK
jgi:hypothetical protein